jgi:dipeptidase E
LQKKERLGNTMGKIVAIGGGEISQGETDRLNQYIVSLTGKAKPRLLFIPTASHDAPGYIETVRQRFGALGCDVDALCLYTQTYQVSEIEDLILGADIVYVGGGDTVRMMEKWSETGVDAALKEAYRRGVVLSGLSAGSSAGLLSATVTVTAL